jgi:hypothetical protein
MGRLIYVGVCIREEVVWGGMRRISGEIILLSGAASFAWS